MKTNQLKEIVEIVKRLEYYDFDFEFDYNEILKLNNEDVELILKNKEKDNVLVLLQFLIYCNRNKDNENFFKELSHLGCSDIKQTVIEKILAADTPAKAEVVYNYFGCDEIVEIFNTEEEWKTYLDELFDEFDDYLIPHFVFFTRKFDKLKKEAIKKVMEFVKDTDDDYLEEIKSLDHLIFSEEEWSNILDLLNEGYEQEGVFKLVTRFTECRKQGIFKEEIEKILEYLTDEPNFFDEELPKFFSLISLEETENIIEFLDEILVSDIFNAYIKSSNSYVEIVMRRYFEKILITESIPLLNAYNTLRRNDKRYFQSLLKDSGEEIKAGESNTKLETIMHFLERIDDANQEDKNSEIYQLVERLPHLPYEIWQFVVIKFDLNRAKLILKNYEYIDYIFCDAISELKCFLNISYDNLEMIFKILRLESFKCDSNKINIYKMMLCDENQQSLNYVYQMYLEQEKKKEEEKKIVREIGTISQITLQTVASLLNSECDSEKVLDGFNADDEITPNTLIRTLKYRNTTN